MLRNIIRFLIPSKGDIFYTLFNEAVANAYKAAENNLAVIKCNDPSEIQQLLNQAAEFKQTAKNIDAKVLLILNQMFITPIDRVDIQELSNLLTKLTKRIVKIGTKLEIYDIQAAADNYLIKNAHTLLQITQALVNGINGLENSRADEILKANQTIETLEEGDIENFRYAIHELYSGKFDPLMVLKLKEVYKSVETAIEVVEVISNLLAHISIKNI